MFNNLSKSIRLVEVGPRDGLQNESKILETSDKIKLIDLLAKAGFKNLEATSFVASKKIPQMSDAQELMKEIVTRDYFKHSQIPCLVPNLKGLELAIKSGVKDIAIFTATSDTFNQKNINANVEESLTRLEEVSSKAFESQLRIRGYISTVFGCPYEKETSVETLLKVAERLQKMGVYEISLGDTIGVGNPRQVEKIINRLKEYFELSFFSMHFHDTYGLALANILTSYQKGITTFDSSAGGLGGCPYALGATGNVATEDVVYMFESMGVDTGVSLDLLLEASTFILNKLEKKGPSRYFQAVRGKGKK